MKKIAVILCFMLVMMGFASLASASGVGFQAIKACPKDGQQDIPVLADINVMFNADIALVNNGAGITVKASNTPLAVDLDVKDNVLWLSPREWLPEKAPITVLIPAGSVAMKGHLNTKLAGDYTFTFTTGEKLQTITDEMINEASGVPILYFSRSFVTQKEVTPPVPSNYLPVATGDTYEVQKGTQLVVAAPGLLKNDTDADGDTLTAVLATNPSHGALDLKADGSFIYTPAAGYTGQDSFTYKAFDGQDYSEIAIVTITVKGDATAAAGDKTPTKTATGKIPKAGGSILLELVIGAAMAATGLAMYCRRRTR